MATLTLGPGGWGLLSCWGSLGKEQVQEMLHLGCQDPSHGDVTQRVGNGRLEAGRRQDPGGDSGSVARGGSQSQGTGYVAWERALAATGRPASASDSQEGCPGLRIIDLCPPPSHLHSVGTGGSVGRRPPVRQDCLLSEPVYQVLLSPALESDCKLVAQGSILRAFGSILLGSERSVSQPSSQCGSPILPWASAGLPSAVTTMAKQLLSCWVCR